MTHWLVSDEYFTETTRFDNDLLKLFSDIGVTSDNHSFNYILSIRFPNKKEQDCPHCRTTTFNYEIERDLWKCKNCETKFSITSGTYIDNSKLEYYHWYRFSYLVGEMGITNSVVIAKDLGVTQKTSWGMIETLRKARKETSERKFTTGTEVLAFNDKSEVLNALLKIDKNKLLDSVKKLYDYHFQLTNKYSEILKILNETNKTIGELPVDDKPEVEVLKELVSDIPTTFDDAFSNVKCLYCERTIEIARDRRSLKRKFCDSNCKFLYRTKSYLDLLKHKIIPTHEVTNAPPESKEFIRERIKQYEKENPLKLPVRRKEGDRFSFDKEY